MSLGSMLRVATVVTLIGVLPHLSWAAPKEHEVKAAYLYNFVKFIDWPDWAFPDATAPLSICVLGEDRFEGVLERAVAGKSVKGRGILVRKPALERLKLAGTTCHILFVCLSEKERTAEILAAVEGSPVLTVGEVEGFAESGGVVNFVIERGKVRLELNIQAAERARLKVSGKLRQVAREVASP